jgi:hypothetical protein
MDMLESAGPIPEEDIHRVFQIVMALVAHGADLSRPRLAGGETSYNANVPFYRKPDPREVVLKLFPPELASRILDASPEGGMEGEKQSSTSVRDGPSSIPGPATVRRGPPGQAHAQTPVGTRFQSQLRASGRRSTLRSKLRRLLGYPH